MSECLQLYNLLLLRLNVATSIGSLNEINPELLIALYRSVSADSEPPVSGNNTESLEYIIKSLETLLSTELEHISSEKLLRKDEQTLYNIVEIYLGLLDLVEDSKEEQSENTKVKSLYYAIYNITVGFMRYKRRKYITRYPIRIILSILANSRYDPR